MALLTVMEKATEAEKRAYVERMLDVMRKADELEGEALQRAMALTAELQERVLGRIHAAMARGADQGGKWNPFWLPRLRQAVDELAHEMADRYGTEVGAFLPRSWMVGGELVDASLSAAAEHVGYASPAGELLPKIQTHEVGIAANWSPELIQGMARATKDVIGKEIAASVLTGESPHVLSKRLAGQITTQGSPFYSVAYRAQLITRTETRRIQGLGAQRRMEQAVARYPKLRMKKTLLVAEVNGWPCEECDAVAKQGPWDVNDPDAPQVPIHPNCRCDMIPDVEGFDAPEPDEKPVDEELDASVSDGERVEEADSAWDSDKHPRGEGGKFGSVGGEDAQHTSDRLSDLHSRSGPKRAYGDNLPSPAETQAVTIRHGDYDIELRNAWAGTREQHTVTEAVTTVSPHLLGGLSHLEFVNTLVDEQGSTLRGNYNIDNRRIDLSRGSDRNYAIGGPESLDLARRTILHEIAHHVYNVTMGRELRAAWEALAGLTGNESIRNVNERFADDFSKYLSEPDGSAMSTFIQRFRA